MLDCISVYQVTTSVGISDLICTGIGQDGKQVEGAATCTGWVVIASLSLVGDLPGCLYTIHRGENL